MDGAGMNTLDQEKWMYEKFWSLLNDRDLMRVFERFGPAAFRRSSVLEGFEEFIRSQAFGGDACVEIGTGKGLTAIVLARHFKRVMTIDIVEDHQRVEFAEFVGANNIDFMTVKDNAGKAAVISKIRVDAAYIDGDHAHDTESDFALVRGCGRVLFHEHWDAQPPVKNLVRDLVRGKPGALTTSGKFALWRAP